MPEYPSHWEADVLLRDGRTTHVRPITPQDAGRLERFHAQLSAETIYFRYFAPYPQLTERDLARFTTVDYDDRVALVALASGEIVGVGRYDRIDPLDAEVAFTIRDDYQGRGLGSVLLEHLAAAARERGVRRFVAEVLPTNRRMIATFEEAGFKVAQEFEEGVVHLTFEIEPTDRMRAVMEAREHRSEARSIETLLFPRSVVVVGASRTPGTIGHELLRHVVGAGFAGPVHAVHPEASAILGVPAVPSISDVSGPVDLAVVAVNADTVPQVVADAAAAGVRGLVVVSGGFADTGGEGAERQRALVRVAHGHGMRVIGPNALGIINTDPRVSLNASLAPVPPERGRIGFFCQSGALGIDILARVARRGLGLTTFVSAGNRADVSGNDLLQYWEEDEATAIVMLYLESIGNPRKFARIARRLSRRKPVVSVRTGGATQARPLGHTVRRTALPMSAVESMFRQAGVIRTDSLDELMDVAGLLAYQPMPRGRRLGVVGNSDAVATLACNAGQRAGLDVTCEPLTVRRDASAETMAEAVGRMVDGGPVDAVLVLYVPPVEPLDRAAVHDAIRSVARRSSKPVLAVLVADRGTGADGDYLLEVGGADGHPGHGSVPVFADVEAAMRALVRVVEYAEWRAAPIGEVPSLPGLDLDGARTLVEGLLDAWEADGGGAVADASGAGLVLTRDELTALLACYGIALWPQRPVHSEEEAVAAADELGWPVALKTTVPRLAHRADLGGVRLSLENERALRTAYLSMVANLAPDAAAHLAVQRMAPPGVACVLQTVEDPLFGPVVSFRLGGAVTELIDDRAFRIPPLTDADAAALVREPGAAPLLQGYHGAEQVDLAALEDLAVRLGLLADELPEVAELELNPILGWGRGVAALDGRAVLRRPDVRTDLDVRRLAAL